jgi:hypothetical protein
MNLPAELLNVLDSLKVDPDSLSRQKANLFVQCGTPENAAQLLSKLRPEFRCTAHRDEVTVFDVVQ